MPDAVVLSNSLMPSQASHADAGGYRKPEVKLDAETGEPLEEAAANEVRPLQLEPYNSVHAHSHLF